MKRILLQDSYPVYITEIDKRETTCQTIDDVVSYLKAMIAENKKVQFIGVFDHHAHTQRIDGEIRPDIHAAVDVIFCFGFALSDPLVLAVRPRAIGVADLGNKFIVSYMEAPMQPANQAMKAWVKGLQNKL